MFKTILEFFAQIFLWAIGGLGTIFEIDDVVVVEDVEGPLTL